MYRKIKFPALLVSIVFVLLSCDKRDEVKHLVNDGVIYTKSVKKPAPKQKPKDERFGFKLKKAPFKNQEKQQTRTVKDTVQVAPEKAKAQTDLNPKPDIHKKKHKQAPMLKRKPIPVQEITSSVRFGINPKSDKDADALSKMHYMEASRLIGKDDNQAMKHIKEARRLSDNGSLLYLQAVVYANKGIWSKAESFAFMASRKTNFLKTSNKLDALKLRLKCLKNLQSVHPSEALHEKIRRAVVEVEIQRGKQ